MSELQNNIQGLADLFQVLGQPSRLRILFGIGQGEVCVCHLEALLKERQAYISQELMMLKDAGLVGSRRSGRNIYYRLKNPELLAQVHLFAKLHEQQIPESSSEPLPGCTCPECNPGSKDCLPESGDEINEQ
jgi:DNA-binding transcriptional ArsR family regulator